VNNNRGRVTGKKKDGKSCVEEDLLIDNRRSFFRITCIVALTFIDGMARGYAIAFVSFFIAL
jgi:hypothetical protein